MDLIIKLPKICLGPLYPSVNSVNTKNNNSRSPHLLSNFSGSAIWERKYVIQVTRKIWFDMSTNQLRCLISMYIYGLFPSQFGYLCMLCSPVPKLFPFMKHFFYFHAEGSDLTFVNWSLFKSACKHAAFACMDLFIFSGQHRMSNSTGVSIGANYRL